MGNCEPLTESGVGLDHVSTPPRCSVYGLYSTEDGVIRYIGQTTWRIEARRNLHLAEASRPPGTSHCHRWIRKVLRSGYKIGVVLLEADCQWDEGEQRWIAEYRLKYPGQLTNISAGGCGFNGKHSEATRLKMRQPRTESTRLKIIAHVRSPAMAAKRLAALAKRNPGNTYGRGEKNGEAVLTENDVIQIHELLRRRVSLQTIAKQFGVSKAAISKIRTGRTWKYLGSWSDPTQR